MTIEAEFADMMTQSITVESPTGVRNNYGRPSYSSATTYRARVVRKNRLVRLDTGKEAVSRTQAWVFGAPGITPDARVTLPDGIAPVILSVESYPDDHGDHHEVIFFGGGGPGQ